MAKINYYKVKTPFSQKNHDFFSKFMEKKNFPSKICPNNGNIYIFVLVGTNRKKNNKKLAKRYIKQI